MFQYKGYKIDIKLNKNDVKHKNLRQIRPDKLVPILSFPVNYGYKWKLIHEYISVWDN